MPERRIPPEAATCDAITDDTHYLSAVAEMAEGRELTANEDIYAGNGLMLVARGTIIRGELRGRLLRHKLLKPIDQSIEVANPVSSELVARDAVALIDERALLQKFWSSAGDTQTLHRALADLPLPAALAFKLTLARDQRPELFRHLLTVASITHRLASQARLPLREVGLVTAAGLFHDLGELHTDPALLAPEHRIKEDEWRHIRVHPITGYVITREAGGLDPLVPTAILQHHERIDGSGYPYGLSGEEIGTPARIVALADVSAAILARHGSISRLIALMRLNSRRYDARLLSILQECLRDGTGVSPVGTGVTRAQLDTAASLLQDWETFRADHTGQGNSLPPELDFLFERMVILRSMLLQFGFDPDSIQSLMKLAAEDPAIATELGTALDEMRWQFCDLSRQIESRRDTILPVLSPDDRDFIGRWCARLSGFATPPEADSH